MKFVEGQCALCGDDSEADQPLTYVFSLLGYWRRKHGVPVCPKHLYDYYRERRSWAGTKSNHRPGRLAPKVTRVTCGLPAQTVKVTKVTR